MMLYAKEVAYLPDRQAESRESAVRSRPGGPCASADSRKAAEFDVPPPGLRLREVPTYGIPVFGDHALFTPRAGFELSGSESRRYRLRLDLEQDDQKLGIGLEGFRHERDGEVPDHGIGVRARMRW